MDIFLNNEKIVTKEDTALLSLLSELNIEASRGVALAVNNQVVPKTSWDNYLLQPNDRITLIRATQGG